MSPPYLDKADALIKAAAEEHIKDMCASIEAMRRATEQIDKKLGDAYPNGLVAEIEDIKRRLDALEKRFPSRR
jgi:hypothetical protein